MRSPVCGAKHGRGGEIRTRDLLNPIQTRYQAALRPADQLIQTAKPIMPASRGQASRKWIE